MAPARSRLLAAVLASLVPVLASAQFATLGDDPGRVRWSAVKTQDYQVVYPRGLDSLASVYARLLQQYNVPVSLSAGYRPNGQYWTRMPVVLHAYTGQANGAVVWAPRRMDLFTLPDAGAMVPMSWPRLLSIHENRHVAQMQFARSGFWYGFHFPYGELPALLVESLYPNKALLEGDAVVAETALTASGRGRSGDFLSYIRMSFDQGDFRNWYRWRYGSIRYYTPDYYRIGYMTVAGMRYQYDAPLFMADYLRGFRNPFRFNSLGRTVRRYSGKRFRAAWDEVAGTFRDIWAEETDLRGPFVTPEPAVILPKVYTSYIGAVAADGFIYAVKTSLNEASVLCEIGPDGVEREVSAFGGDGKLAWSETLDRLFWTETIPDVRWTLKQDSRIRFWDRATGKKGRLTRHGRYFNPAVSPDGRTLCAVEYPLDGTTAAVVIDAQNGDLIWRQSAPAGVQWTEAVFQDGALVLAGISDEGSGLYRIPLGGGPVETLLEPLPVSIRHLSAVDGNTVLFDSDRTGVSEAYTYRDGTFCQLTSTRYGLSYPFYCQGRLYASALLPEGRLPSALDAREVPVDFTAIHRDRIADTLTAQEEALSAGRPESAVTLSPVRRFYKATNLLHFHSWMPLYYNYDRFTATYSDYYFETASLGLTGFFQNKLGTAWGTVGLSVHEKAWAGDPTSSVGAHFRMTYTGLYPVFDLALDVGDRSSALLVPMLDTAKDSLFVRAESFDKLYVGGKVAVSLPFDFSSGGWDRKLEPSLSMSLSNDYMFEPFRPVVRNQETGGYEKDDAYSSLGMTGRSTVYKTTATLRGSFTREQAVAKMMPSAGGGFEAGVEAFSGNWIPFGKAYAYLTGMHPRHSLKLAAAARSRHAELYSVWYKDPVSVLPRGFEKADGLESLVGYIAPEALMLSADYAMPIFPMDFAAGPYFYLRNLELVPFADLSLLRFQESLKSTGTSLLSIGADIAVNFQKFLAVSNEFRLGVRFAWNGGSAFDFLSESTAGLKQYYVGAVLNTEF